MLLTIQVVWSYLTAGFTVETLNIQNEKLFLIYSWNIETEQMAKCRILGYFLVILNYLFGKFQALLQT